MAFPVPQNWGILPGKGTDLDLRLSSDHRTMPSGIKFFEFRIEIVGLLSKKKIYPSQNPQINRLRQTNKFIRVWVNVHLKPLNIANLD